MEIKIKFKRYKNYYSKNKHTCKITLMMIMMMIIINDYIRLWLYQHYYSSIMNGCRALSDVSELKMRGGAGGLHTCNLTEIQIHIRKSHMTKNLPKNLCSGSVVFVIEGYIRRIFQNKMSG